MSEPKESDREVYARLRSRNATLADLVAYREEIEARLAPASAQAREDERTRETLLRAIEEGKKYLDPTRHASFCHCIDCQKAREDEALLDRLAIQIALGPKKDDGDGGVAWIKDLLKSALRSRPSATAAELPIPAAKTADLLGLKIYTSDAIPEGVIVIRRESLHEILARPSPQGEDALADERETLEHWDENDIGTLTNALESAIDAYDALRARLASAQSSAQGEEAREMREAAQELLDLMDEVEIDPALGDETDRVFSRAEFARLRAVIGEAK